MNERVVSLTDRGRALEWLSLGFGLWLIGGLVFAMLALDATNHLGADDYVTIDTTLALISCAIHLLGGGALALGAVLLARSGAWLWSGGALAALAVAVFERTAIVLWMAIEGGASPWLPTYAWSVGAMAELVMLALLAMAVRDLASREGRVLPVSLLGAVAGAGITRWLLVATLPFDHHTLARSPMQPWVHAALIGVVSVVSVGLVLLAIREASEVVRGQVWSGQPDAASPARAADWQRTAAGLNRFSAFMVAKLFLGLALVIPFAALPLAGALASAAMATALFACRRVPDPPDARSGFTGAAAVIAACAIAELCALTAAGDPMLTGVVSWLGHLVAYVAVLRSIGRIGERLGDDEVTRRARVIGWMAVGGVGCAVPAGFLAVRSSEELGTTIAAPIVVGAVVVAALLPCAILARELARTLRGRFAEPPRAVVRSS